MTQLDPLWVRLTFQIPVAISFILQRLKKQIDESLNSNHPVARLRQMKELKIDYASTTDV